MGSINAIDNYDRLTKDFLAPGTRRLLGGESVQGEHVRVAAIDGRFRVLDARPDGTRDDGVRWARATLMMTERHAIAYQARGGFRRDYGIAVPYRSIAMVSYRLLDARHGKMATIGMRFEPRNGRDPMLEFATDVDDAFAYDATIKAVLTACAIGGVRTDDESDRATMDALGLRPVPGGSYVDPSIATVSAFDDTIPSGAFRDGSAMVDTSGRVYYPMAYAMPSQDEMARQQQQPQQTRQQAQMTPQTQKPRANRVIPQAQGGHGVSVKNTSRGIGTGTGGRAIRSDGGNVNARGGSRQAGSVRGSWTSTAGTARGETLRGDMSGSVRHDGMDAGTSKNGGGNRLRRSHSASGSGTEGRTQRRQAGNSGSGRRIGV